MKILLKSNLLVAIQNNDINLAEGLLTKGVDPDTRFYVDSQEKPAICLCVERGHVEMVRLFIKWGCSINQFDASGHTPLHLAAIFRYESITEILLQNRANVKALSNSGQTALHLARELAVVKMLVAAGSDINKQDQDGRTALILACMEGKTSIVKFLIQKGADVNITDIYGNSPLLHASNCLSSDPTIISVLLRNGAKVNHQNNIGENALLIAVKHCHFYQCNEIVEILLKNGCELNVNTWLGQSPLHLAINGNDDCLVELLIRFGCNPNVRDALGLTPLYYLAKDGKTNLIFLLLASGLNMQNETWVKDELFIREIRSEFRDWLITKSREFPPLKNLCRTAIRKYLGIRAEDIINQLPLPNPITEFLNLAY
ncbi:putative ankyrin repeat protein RF_0381 isoform X1 [Centruroides vittatus]|uniref:putative ankyrin repeat protein RF_0381 isoform X1 n=1 Tax=Centruroides vittatus TaxID=120091 RepID=UPI00350ED7C6